ncbi:DUF6111 family protein [Hyphomicrobium sp. D-2]|uniref:DUF6111 family protein n=1 Tax=Hyphomicrobium sp. D-2 TaxID=3041621 RepID=UPI00245383A7|nr:DUF6111 family protein [Hyphomicrobium sp. D-2]MDH4980773.1 DUF6111 family protein [Hyphomicrobium sp. D-2]
MIRIVAENIFFFLLPTIIYVAYVYMTREEKPEAKRVLNDAPLLWLFLAGVVLVVIVLVSFGKMEGGKPGQVYKPPVYKDGKVIPGHFE